MPITPAGAFQRIVSTPMSFVGGYSQSSSAYDQLQNVISSATSGIGELPPGVTHHPITCSSKLNFNEDGVFSCEHFEVPSDDMRTKASLIHSIAYLIIEEAFRFDGMNELPFDRSNDGLDL